LAGLPLLPLDTGQVRSSSTSAWLRSRGTYTCARHKRSEAGNHEDACVKQQKIVTGSRRHHEADDSAVV
jgi:hypothetical protein